MRIAILGFGREGKSVLKFLKRSAKYRHSKIQILDQKNDPHYLRHLDSFDLIFRSPGVPYNLPEIQKAIRAGVKITSATKLFFELCKSRIIGVTGTKGKGTTSTLIYKILKASGKKVLLAGNIGTSPLEILPKITSKTLVILELSSFQLWDLEKSPSVAVLTDIFPDHQDVHKNMKEYLESKSNIARHQKRSDSIFYFASNPLAKKIAQRSRGRKISVAAPGTLEKNKILAAAVARRLGCPEAVIKRTLSYAKGLEHRLEFVRAVRGIRFYDDSASTNPQTTAAAIASFREPVILIAGGKDKNLNYGPLAKAIRKSGRVKLVILMGENKEKIRRAIAGSKVRTASSKGLSSAVRMAYKFADTLSSVILFSPGAASFDMFKDYADRGNQFKKIIRRMAD